jgi:hypothetical protein
MKLRIRRVYEIRETKRGGLPRLKLGSFLEPSLSRSSILRIISLLMLATTDFSFMMATDLCCFDTFD